MRGWDAQGASTLVRANGLPLEKHDRQPSTSITVRASDLAHRVLLFKRQNDLPLELSMGPAYRAFDPYSDLSQHPPNHRIAAGIYTRHICALSEQKYYTGAAAN